MPTAAELLHGYSPALAALSATTEAPRAAEALFGPSAALRALETRYVRTPAGAARYGLPIGSPIGAATKTAGKAAKAAASGAAKVAVVEKPHTHESILAHAETLSDADLERLHQAIAEMHHARQAKAAAAAVPRASGSHVPSPPDKRAAPVESAIFQAYQELKRPHSDYVGLADLRERLDQQGFSREQVDEVLRSSPAVEVLPESNQKTLTARDRAASIRVGGQDSHLVYFSPSYRPPAGPAVAKAAPAKGPVGAGTSEHVAHLESIANQVSKTNYADQADAARQYLARLKGPELTALAKHLGVRYDVGTVAKKRARIYDLVVGGRVQHYQQMAI